MTTIAYINGKWYVVKSQVIESETCGKVIAWSPISDGYDTSEQARARQADIVFGRV